jgi:hypothetical protein
VTGKFYVIGSRGSDIGTLRHEIVHGLFYTDETYRDKVLAELKKIETKPFWKVLNKMGYCEAVLHDEINAYAIAGMGELVSRGVPAKLGARVKKRFRKLFAKHFGYRIVSLKKDELLALVHVREL